MQDTYKSRGIAHTVCSTSPVYQQLTDTIITAVLQVASSLIADDLARLVDHVKDLVGETDFSFTVSVSDSSLDSTASESSGKGKKD